MKLLHVTDDSFTDQRWRALYALKEYMIDKYEILVPRIGWERTRDRHLSLTSHDPYYFHFVVFDGDEPIGWADFSVLSPKTPEQNAVARFEVKFENAPEEFERLVAGEYLRLFELHGVKSVHLGAGTARTSRIAAHWHGIALNKYDVYRLRRSEANVALMRSWLEEIPRANPELRMEFFSSIPERHLEVYTKLFGNFIREMPTEREAKEEFHLSVADMRRDNEWRENNGMATYTMAVFNADDEMIGHSNASISEADPVNVHQFISGVNSEYRGRGLSRWMKATLFFKIGEDFPANKTISTEMRATNEPIHRVNAQMGYQLFSSGFEYELPAAGLRKFLGL